MRGVEWPIPPQRRRVLVREGWEERVWKRLIAGWRTEEAQRIMASVGGDIEVREGTWELARKEARRLMSVGEGIALFAILT